jgi:hypothetical protein
MAETKKIKFREYQYDVFHEIHGDVSVATVRGKNWADAKKVFKKIYGNFKITHHQRLGKV